MGVDNYCLMNNQKMSEEMTVIIKKLKNTTRCKTRWSNRTTTLLYNLQLCYCGWQHGQIAKWMLSRHHLFYYRKENHWAHEYVTAFIWRRIGTHRYCILGFQTQTVGYRVWFAMYNNRMDNLHTNAFGGK